MKNLLVANYRRKGKASEAELRTLIDAQIENSLALGWAAADVVIVTNLALEAPVHVIRSDLNEFCLTGSKMFALHHLFDQGLIHDSEVWWAHDLDAWQNYWFEPPDFADIALAEYSNPKFNGGSLFLRAAACDLVSEIVTAIQQTRGLKEEPAINQVLRSAPHRHRVTTLNSTYNIGCSAYAPRYERSLKPILVSHFHPTGSTSWKTHVDGVNQLGIPSVSPRLLELLVRKFHGGVAPDFLHREKGRLV